MYLEKEIMLLVTVVKIIVPHKCVHFWIKTKCFVYKSHFKHLHLWKCFSCQL